MTPFQRMFAEQYDVIHRLETNKLRNVAKLFAHLLHTDAISWEVCIMLLYSYFTLWLNFNKLEISMHHLSGIAIPAGHVQNSPLKQFLRTFVSLMDS